MTAIVIPEKFLFHLQYQIRFLNSTIISIKSQEKSPTFSSKLFLFLKEKV